MALLRPPRRAQVGKAGVARRQPQPAIRHRGRRRLPEAENVRDVGHVDLGVHQRHLVFFRVGFFATATKLAGHQQPAGEAVVRVAGDRRNVPVLRRDPSDLGPGHRDARRRIGA